MPLILNRIALRMRIDPAKQRIDLDPSELGNADLGVALTGSLDFSTDDPRLVLGIAGTRMSVAAMKLLWPICTAPKVRAWVARTCAGRHRRPAGHLDQRAVVHTQDERPACSRRRSADPDRRQRRGSPPGRRPAGDLATPTSICAFPAARR